VSVIRPWSRQLSGIGTAQLAMIDDEVEQYRKHHAAGTKARLALEVLLMTGHARSDVIRMGDQYVRNGRLSMSRKKTGTEFAVPLLPELVAELALHRRNGAVASMTWLVTERGTPFGSAASFGNWFADRCREAGVPGRAHGLRKASAIRHALHGATAHELMAWHGWKTIGEAQSYVEKANKMRLADNAAEKIISGTEIVSATDPLRQIGEKDE
jgi:Phage integrase family